MNTFLVFDALAQKIAVVRSTLAHPAAGLDLFAIKTIGNGEMFANY